MNVVWSASEVHSSGLILESNHGHLYMMYLAVTYSVPAMDDIILKILGRCQSRDCFFSWGSWTHTVKSILLPAKWKQIPKPSFCTLLFLSPSHPHSLTPLPLFFLSFLPTSFISLLFFHVFPSLLPSCLPSFLLYPSLPFLLIPSPLCSLLFSCLPPFLPFIHSSLFPPSIFSFTFFLSLLLAPFFLLQMLKMLQGPAKHPCLFLLDLLVVCSIIFHVLTFSSAILKEQSKFTQDFHCSHCYDGFQRRNLDFKWMGGCVGPLQPRCEIYIQSPAQQLHSER